MEVGNSADKAQESDRERGLEVSELPCSTGERAVAVEPVTEIAMAELEKIVARRRRESPELLKFFKEETGRWGIARKQGL